MKSSRSSQSKGKSAAKKSTAKSAPKKASNGRTSSNGTAAKSRSASSTRAKASSSSRGSRTTASKASSSRSRSKTQSTHREGLMDVLKDGLKDIYYAEKQLYKALNKVAKACTNEELKAAVQTHREETGEQVTKLEQAFELLGMKAVGKKCPAMDGLIEEANEHIEEMDKGPALDAALIVGAQKVEHYEIAAYGSLRTFANDLGYPECAEIFQQILDQESSTDEKLTQIAQTVNREALAEDSEEDNRNVSRVTAAMAEADMDDE